VSDEHRRAIQKAQERNDVVAVAIDRVGAGGVVGVAVAAQVDPDDPAARGDLGWEEVIGPRAARDPVQEDDEPRR
jgi:hypothetical protein